MKRSHFQVKPELLRRLRVWLILAGLALLVFIFGRGVWHLWTNNSLAGQRERESATQVAELSKRKIFLERKIAELKTDRGLEEELRTSFSVVRPGEKVINIVDPDKATLTATSTPAKSHWWQIF